MDIVPELHSFYSRAGMPFLRHKIEQKSPIRIVIFGNSVTIQNGWRTLAFKWLCQRFPEVSFTELVEGPGGMNLGGALNLLDKKVLQHKPDLVFIEKTSGSVKLQPPYLESITEQIIRRIRVSNPECEICFLHAFLPMYIHNHETTVTNLILPIEKILEYYGVPSINFAQHIYTLYQDSKIILDRNHYLQLLETGETKDSLKERVWFSLDGVHTIHGSGDQLYTDVFQTGFTSILNVSNNTLQRDFPERLASTNLELPLAKIIGDLPDDTIEIMGYSGLRGPFPSLSRFKNLQYLVCPGNDCQARFPDIHENLQLKVVDLATCQLHGPLPDLRPLQNLQNLHIPQNNLEGSLEHLAECRNLEDLMVNKNNFSGSFPELKDCTKLKNLRLIENAFSGTLPDLSKMVNLQAFACRENHFTGYSSGSFQLPSLLVVNFCKNQFSPDVIEEMLFDLTVSLRKRSNGMVQVSMNGYSHFTAASIKYIKQLKQAGWRLSHGSIRSVTEQHEDFCSK